MRCKKHIDDSSSFTGGVCASCLRERLFVLIVAQNKYNLAQQQDRRRSVVVVTDDNNNPFPAVDFPRSVSPAYVSRRQSDCTFDVKLDGRGLPDQRFYSTPQVGPNGNLIIGEEGSRFYRKRKNGMRISWVSSLFRSKSEKHNPGFTNPDVGDTCSTTWRSPLWVGKVFSSRRKTFLVDEPKISDKGMSPARCSDEEDENWNHRSSGSSSECSRPRNKTSKKTPPARVAPGRRGGSNGKSGNIRDVSGFGFCWSPLVRASPSLHWNQKGIPSEFNVSGDLPPLPMKPPPCNVVALCKNRSRKLADFGRCRHNR